MTPKTHVNFIWFRMGESFRNANPAPTLYEDMAGLTDYFRNQLRKTPETFDSTVALQGFAAIRLSFRAIGQTVALAVFHPHTAGAKVPDALCLLINGLEEPAEMTRIRAQVKLPDELWELLDKSEKPVVAAAFHVNGRLRDPATITVMQVVANVYFNMFGTNAVGEPE